MANYKATTRAVTTSETIKGFRLTSQDLNNQTPMSYKAYKLKKAMQCRATHG